MAFDPDVYPASTMCAGNSGRRIDHAACTKTPPTRASEEVDSRHDRTELAVHFPPGGPTGSSNMAPREKAHERKARVESGVSLSRANA